ncbi:MAG: peptidase M24 family protein [Clostridiales bacterium]|nr:MAG: peptidase M24 family protein [Clostridiales bacterium]
MYRERIEKVSQKMQQNGIDYLLINAPDSVLYLTGQLIAPGERMMVALIDKRAELKLFVHDMFKVDLPIGEVTYFGDSDNPVQILSEQLKNDVRIGIDKEWQARFLMPLMETHSAEYVLGSACVDDVRLIKSAAEIALMEEASNINDRAMSMVYQWLCENDESELEMQGNIKSFFSELGAEGISFTPIVCYGANGAEPHHEPDETMPSEGAVLVDMGCVYKSYCSDMTRSFYRGKPTEKYLKAYQAVLSANLKAIAAVKPGVKMSEIDAVARGEIESAGLGEYFIHRTGHGIGIVVHEFPDVSASSDAVCQPGMFFSIEPGVYLPGEFGIRIEDLVMVTEDGCKVINNYPKELQLI